MKLAEFRECCKFTAIGAFCPEFHFAEDMFK